MDASSGRRRRAAMLAAGFGLLLAAAAPPAPREEPGPYRFSYDHILGTSLDLLVVAPTRDRAVACQTAVLDEIERLRRILSTYDPRSDISRLNAASSAVDVPPELMEILALYETWRLRTGGVFNGQLGSILELWKTAQKAGKPPDDLLLMKLAGEIQGPAVDLDAERGTARRRTDQKLNVNALGKNYILAMAVQAARAKDPGLRGLLLDIGGDIVCWGSASESAGTPWRIGVADPERCYENAPPMTRVLLRDRAIASSGCYERFYTVGGRRYSHIVDPRSGRPAEGVLGATVIARDPVTADALSTALCVLAPGRGLELVAGTQGAECLIVSSDGTRHPSPGWGALEDPERPLEVAQQKNPAWPEKFQVSMEILLAKSPPGKPYCRPYVAIWIEDAAKKPVRTLEVWGKDPRYVKELSDWWSFGGKDAKLVQAVAKATRDGGKYTLVWDGMDDQGKPVRQGVYVVRVEVHREHGRHVRDMGAALACRAKPVTVEIKGNVEVDGIRIQYGAGVN